jgi:hypothetical protein
MGSSFQTIRLQYTYPFWSHLKVQTSKEGPYHENKAFRDEIRTVLNYYKISVIPSKDFDIVCRNQTSVAVIGPQQPAPAPEYNCCRF